MSSLEATYEATRSDRFEKWLRDDDFPPSYSVNTPAETELLANADAFRTQYHEFYPRRAPLLLTPLNECHARKMICTFIRPTLPPYEELFDLDACVTFLAGYMRYEPLAEAEKLPNVVVSPATALSWQIGNCFELSLIAASFLTGAGYNVYVVVGYARPFVCQNDSSQRLWRDTDGLFAEEDSDEETSETFQMDPEYAALLRERPVLRGVADAEPTPPLSSAQSAPTPTRGAAQATSPSASPPRLVHCWLLVLPGGRRSHKEAVFIEPSTGERLAPAAADDLYAGIESVFSGREYFVNLTPRTPVSAITLDLRDGTCWEPLQLRAAGGEDAEASPGDGTPAQTATMAGERHNASVGPSAARWRHGDLAATVGGPLLAARERPAGSGGPFPDKCGAGLSATGRRARRSWGADLTLSRAQFESRFPGGCKAVRYANAEVRHYAAYATPDLRVMEVRLPDARGGGRQQLHIRFRHRADRLRRRSLFPAAEDGGGEWRLLKEWYDRGRMREAAVEGLRVFVHEYGVRRGMRFYWDARDDGLWRREELFYEGLVLRKVREFYRGREDRLWYRGATFAMRGAALRGRRRSSAGGLSPTTTATTTTTGTTSTTAVGAMAGGGAGLGLPAPDEPQRLEPIRASEKYLRHAAVPPDGDVAKYTFVRPPDGNGGEVWVFFHYRPGSVIRPHRMYAKGARGEEYLSAAAGEHAPPPPMTTIALMPNAEPPTELEQFNERKRLLWRENVCLGKIRARMLECHEILVSMRATDRPRAVLSVFDTLRNHPRETEAEQARKIAEEAAREESRRDYLAPYIAKLELGRHFDGDYMHVALTMEQARQVRDEALRELKERLIHRGRIMQAQMDKEKEEFGNRQGTYQASLDAAGIAAGRDEEEFAQYCKEATWRMKALDERLAKHIDQASDKYAKLAQRLAEDPRLMLLYKQTQANVMS